MGSRNSIPTATAEFKWSASLRDAALLMIIALVATGVSWVLRSDGLPVSADPEVYDLELAAPLVQTTEALVRYEEGDFLFVDTRPDLQGEFQTIPGAFFISEATFDDDLLEYFDFMTTEDHLILFGDGNLFPVSDVAGRLMDRGYPNLYILKGGLSAWRVAGGDISNRTGAEK